MQYLDLLFLSTIPVIELRGAIPMGILSGLNPILVYIVCVIGSTMISIPLVLTFRHILHTLKRFKIFYKIGYKIDNTINKKMRKLRSLSVMGIALFVGIPLPTTGSWSASVMASMLNMRLKYAFLGVLFGNLLSGIIISLVTLHLI